MKKIFYLPISVFLFGLMLILIRYFTPQLPIWLCQFGLFLVYCAKFFPVWQGWALMVIAYLMTGIFLLNTVVKISIYNVYGRIEPKWSTWVLWAITWPYAVIKLGLF